MYEDCLKRKLTLEEAERESLVTDDRLGPAPVPFGACNQEWAALLAKIQPVDEFWEFRSGDETWKLLCGCAGIALVRKGKVVGSILTEIN